MATPGSNGQISHDDMAADLSALPTQPPATLQQRAVAALSRKVQAWILAGLVIPAAGYAGKDWVLGIVGAAREVPVIRQEQAVQTERIKSVERRLDDDGRRLSRIEEGVEYLVRREIEKSDRARGRK